MDIIITASTSKHFLQLSVVSLLYLSAGSAVVGFSRWLILVVEHVVQVLQILKVIVLKFPLYTRTHNLLSRKVRKG